MHNAPIQSISLLAAFYCRQTAYGFLTGADELQRRLLMNGVLTLDVGPIPWKMVGLTHDSSDLVRSRHDCQCHIKPRRLDTDVAGEYEWFAGVTLL